MQFCVLDRFRLFQYASMTKMCYFTQLTSNHISQLLQQHGDFDDVNSWPVIGQFSSIGSLGSDQSNWLCSEWLKSLSTCKDETSSNGPNLHLVSSFVSHKVLIARYWS